MAKRRSVLLVANPVARRGHRRRTPDAVARQLRAWGLEAVVEPTLAPGHAEHMTREVVGAQMDRWSCVAACGGDGTVQEVANALADLRQAVGAACPPLGVIPLGRCNDFARALGIPRQVTNAAAVLATGEPTPVDLGKAGGRYFCTVATAGIDAEISRYVDQARIPLFGTPAYLLGAALVLTRYRPRPLTIRAAFGVLERPVFLASTANTSSYGGAVPIAPGASPTDGLLDLCVIDGMPLHRALRLIPSILRGRHAGHTGVHFLRARSVTIESPTPQEIWADGQYITDTPVTIEVVPQALSVLQPRRHVATPARSSTNKAHVESASVPAALRGT